MPARVSEALVLRTYPLKEADLVVSFLTRDQGKLRGVAKRARRPKSGSARGWSGFRTCGWRISSAKPASWSIWIPCELIQSQFGLASDYRASVALDYFAEVSEQLLPSAEPSEKFFRLLLAVLESSARRAAKRAACGAPSLISRCGRCGFRAGFRNCMLPRLRQRCWTIRSAERAFFSRGRPGLFCGHCRTDVGGGNSWELSAASRAIAAEMLRRPVAQISTTPWEQETAADLRRFLVQQIEAHAERRLITAPMLEA